MPSDTDYDILIVGAGPGGCATAISLEGTGLSVCLIDKATFPRDKICGDALSPDVLNQLANLEGNLKDRFIERYAPRKVDVTGVRIVSANGKMAELSIQKGREKIKGWVAKRIDFDNFMYEEASRLTHVTVMTDTRVDDIEIQPDKVVIQAGEERISGSLVIGADGAHSVVSKQLTNFRMDRDHYCGAVRAYYENVHGFHSDGMIELHFYKSLLPGYFWIFPLPDNRANVGLGMLSSFISKRKVNLKAEMLRVIETEPGLRDRFRDAVLEDKIHGFGLPLGSKKRSLSGERFMLIGDAASLIDPITGEGVGNAIRSGRYAAAQAVRSMEANDFSAETMKQYDKVIYDLVWGEMRFSRMLQTGFRYPIVINFLTGMAVRSVRFRNFLNLAISDAGFWADGFNPRRWLRHWRRAARFGD